jgi:hypothetical protein
MIPMTTIFEHFHGGMAMHFFMIPRERLRLRQPSQLKEITKKNKLYLTLNCPFYLRCDT